MKRYLPLIALALVAVLIGGAIFFMGDDEESQPSSSESTAPSADNTETTPPASPPAATTASQVTMENSAFAPSNITVQVGTTVTWVNNDNTLHDVVTDSEGGPNSSDMQQGDTFSYKFDSVGEFSYHCSYHPSMVGKVTVIE